MVIDLSGMSFYPGAGIRIIDNKTTGCTFPDKSIGLIGNYPNMPANQPADINAVDGWYENAIIHAGDTFDVHFTCQNIEQKATGPFVVALQLDNVVDPDLISIDNLNPGEYREVYWEYGNGLPVGNYQFLAYFDYYNSVVESNKTNNYKSLGVIVYDPF